MPTAPPTVGTARAQLNIYHEPTLNERSEHANNFKLHKINEVQTTLEKERDKRANLAKKYHLCREFHML